MPLRWHTFVGGKDQLFVDRKEAVALGKKVVPTMYKRLKNGQYEVATRGHPRCGEIVKDIGYDESETYEMTVRTRRLISCRVTYSLPTTDEHHGWTDDQVCAYM